VLASDVSERSMDLRSKAQQQAGSSLPPTMVLSVRLRRPLDICSEGRRDASAGKSEHRPDKAESLDFANVSRLT
jgi:hypothetical protein